MRILSIGIGLPGTEVGQFYLKDRVKSPMIARIALCEWIMRFAAIAVAMIVIDAILALGNLL